MLEVCVYCGGPPETRDHVPSQVFLDKSLQDDPPKVGACKTCNLGFSRHEQYLACFIETVRVGSADPTLHVRPKVRRTLSRSTKLASRIAASSRTTLFNELVWIPEPERVNNVVLKLARGHAAYELGEPQLHAPDWIATFPLLFLSDEELHSFENVPAGAMWAEVGGRALQRQVLSCPNTLSEWLVVQPERYRYLVSIQDGVLVRIVISDYLACEVRWSSET